MMADDLAAVRARLERRAPNRVRESASIYQVCDVLALLAAYDAQAANLERIISASGQSSDNGGNTDTVIDGIRHMRLTIERLLGETDAQAARLAAVEQARDDFQTSTYEMLGELLDQHQVTVDPCPGGPCVANALIAIGEKLTAAERERDALATEHAHLKDAMRFGLGDPMCGIVSHSGPCGEPLACGWPPHGTERAHSWATLPTFTEANDAD